MPCPLACPGLKSRRWSLFPTGSGKTSFAAQSLCPCWEVLWRFRSLDGVLRQSFVARGVWNNLLSWLLLMSIFFSR
jgi:hypothetical protein